MNCTKLNYDFVIGGTGFTLERGGGVRVGWDLIFVTATINK